MPASINDYGGADPDRLDAPPLGGPDGWAAAVVAALDGDNTSVDTRIGNHEAAADPHPGYVTPAEHALIDHGTIPGAAFPDVAGHENSILTNNGIEPRWSDQIFVDGTDVTVTGCRVYVLGDFYVNGELVSEAGEWSEVTSSSVTPVEITGIDGLYDVYYLEGGDTIVLAGGKVRVLVAGSGGGGQNSTLAGGACGGSVVQGTVLAPPGTFTATINGPGGPGGGTGGSASINMLGGIVANGGLGGTMYAGTTAVAGGTAPTGTSLLPGGDGGAPNGHYGTPFAGGIGPTWDVDGLAYGSGGTAGTWDASPGPVSPGGGASDGGQGVDGRGGGGGGGRHTGGSGGRGGYGIVAIAVKQPDPPVVIVLEDLGDVSTVGAISGDALVFNGTEWVPGAGVGDPGPAGPAGPAGPTGPAGPVVYQSTPPLSPVDGTVWVDEDDVVPYVNTLASLTDVDLTGAVDGNALVLDAGVWVPSAGGGGGGGGGGGATGGGTDQVFYENDTVVTTDYTITAGKNAMTAGPVSIDPGVTVTIPSGSSWVVL